MKNLLPEKLTILFLLLFLLNSALSAQNRTLIGVNLTTNYDTYTFIKPEAGLIFERQITLHSGIEAGINYRTYQLQLYFLVNNQSYYPLINEKYISIPVSCKFYTKVINASLGISYDYYIGWSQRNSDADVVSYRQEYDYYLGPFAKISRQINLGNNLVLEPELKATILVVPQLMEYYGFGLVGKFCLRKDLPAGK